MAADEKQERYRTVSAEILSVVAGETNIAAKMATAACLLSRAFPAFSWTGFYAVDPEKPDELIVGPYQGPLGCLRIRFGRGVCGSVALSRETEIVPDVHAHPNHIFCDSGTRSEIVVPVFGPDGALIAVLDIDSHELAAFDETDKAALEPLMAALFTNPALGPRPAESH